MQTTSIALRALLFLVVSSTAPAAAAETALKIATLAPEGSSWMRMFHAWAQRIEARTDGRVRPRFYAGGIQGDERDMLRKIRLGQLSGAAITGIGLSSIAPEVRALEQARSYHDLDALRTALDGELRARFEARGFVLASWGDVGPVHLFSKKPIRTLADLRAARLWAWSDDPVSKLLVQVLALQGVPLGVPDVLPALSTGQVDAFFGSPLSTVALQWASHAGYMSTVVLSQATGALVIDKAVLDRLPAADRAVVRQESDALQAEVLRQVRVDNEQALVALRRRGVQPLELSPELIEALARAGTAIARSNAAGFTREFSDRVQQVMSRCCAAGGDAH